MFVPRTISLGVLLGALVLPMLPSRSQAQGVCNLETNTDPLNWTYNPPVPHALRTGFLSVLAQQTVGGDLQKNSSVERFFTPLATQRSFTVSGRVNLTDAYASLFGLGGGEAGIQLRIEAFVGSTRECVQETTLFIARFNEDKSPPLGIRNLGCSFSRTSAASTVRVKVTFHAWATVGGFAQATARLSGTVQNMALNACTNSCSGSCGGSAGGCFCDSSCVSFGDCCGDYAPRCATSSCWGSCGGAAPSGACFCDAACTGFGDCCTDFATVCE